MTADDALFLRACRREPVERTPVWLMRQAGRYMAEYRAVREKVSFLELVYDPALCAEVMITAVDKLGVDAAIIFSDILPILEPLGFELTFAAGDGPVIHNPIRHGDDLSRIRELDSMDPLSYVAETVRLTREGLGGRMPVIGFSGAPFTLASYAIEGGGSKNYIHTKQWMFGDLGSWHELMAKLARAVTVYLNGQIAAGAQAVQLFDSWVGALNEKDFRAAVLPHLQAIVAGLPPDVPVIYFAHGNPELLRAASETGASVLGIDWRVSLGEAWRRVGENHAVQGNLDPTVLFAPVSVIRERLSDVLLEAGNRPGHIFNLGHGILPHTPVDHVVALVEMVRELSERTQ
jgi:uroporphyrinogen decarboxylase